MAQPLLIFDGKCGFCRIWIEYWKRLTGGRVAYAPSQDVGAQYPQIPPEAFADSVQLVRPDGSFVGGAQAVFETLGWERAYRELPLLAPMAEAAYRVIARHRNFFYWVTRLCFGSRVEPARFQLTQSLFLRVLALVYLIAFASLGVQVKGLLGGDGIAPARAFLGQVGAGLGSARYFAVPTVFWLNADDLVLQVVCWLGAVLAVVLFAGRMERLILIVLYVLYLSFSLAGQEFLSFQWDALLLEAGFLAIFFGGTLGTQRTFAWLMRWLVFRLYFLSGYVKLASGDPNWSGLTALDYHYWTQPLPNAIAWYAAKLPEWFQRASTFGVLAIELGTPFLIFMPRRIRMAAACAMLALQALIFLTGNYTFFNILTAALTVFLFDDQALGWVRRWLPRRSREEPGPSSRPALIGAAFLTAFLVPMGLARMLEAVTLGLPRPLDAVLTYAAPFQVVNSYGLFAVMTTTRPEIVIEGSNDGVEWKPYEFRYKPGDIARAPRFVAPHQPRLDWQMWFAALRDYRASPWFLMLAERLLEGSPAVLALLEENPFPDRPPRYVRAQLYQYHFTDQAARRATGAWWRRDLAGEYLPPIGLRK
jgi:predicted DCC family thiol-disulfide oxidoreductase YuxK